MISNSILMELIANGTLWYYQSYDHRAAIDEMRMNGMLPSYVDDYNFGVPIEFRRSNIVWRIGKLRTMTFDPDGFVRKMYVGRSFKFTKCFFPRDVGTVLIKPIINPQEDKYNLIKDGLAINENKLKK